MLCYALNNEREQDMKATHRTTVYVKEENLPRLSRLHNKKVTNTEIFEEGIDKCEKKYLKVKK